jgi:HK97 family phage major capsid protein
MQFKKFEQVQKDLQSIADQVGETRFAHAKMLYLEGVVVTDAEGNPLAPEQLKYEVMLSPAAAETDAADPTEEMPKEEEPAKALRETVKSAIAAELKAVNTMPNVTSTDTYKITGKAKFLASNDEAYRFGRFIMAARGHRKSADWCAANGLVTKGHQENINSAGGFLVPEEFESSLISLRERYGVFRRNARIVPMSTDTKRMPRRKSTLTAYAIGEAAAGTESEQVFEQVNLVAKKFMVLTTASNELNEDAIVNLGDDIANEIAYAFSLKEDECGFTGTGTSTFGGIIGVAQALLNVDGTRSNVKGIQDASGNWGATTVANINSLMALLPAYADSPSCKFYCSKAFYHGVMERLAYAAGGVTARDIKDGSASPVFFGYPVEFTQAMPRTTGAQISLLFGDLSMAAYFGDRRQTSIAFSDSALNAFEQDEIAVRGTERFDINVANVGDTTDAGPIVGLYTTS